MKALVSTALLLLCIVGYSESAGAQEEVRVQPVDVYVSGFGGYSLPFNTDVSSGGFTVQDVELENSPSFGGKIGLWVTAPRKTLGIDIGAEINVTHFDPDPTMNATYFGVNLMARLPMGVGPELPNGRWFPYVGLGGGAQRLSVEVLGFKEGNTVTAFQGLGGVKVFLFKHVAVFAEGKFTHASHRQVFHGFSPVDFTVNAVHGVGGLSLHF
ncbi:MAG: outer membrane beta-barrel protein [Nitrospira sp.]|nr:outer membrane beta-barrel protein [Nitrospira sp.]